MAERSLGKLKHRWEAYLVSREELKKKEKALLVRAAYWLVEPMDALCSSVSQGINKIHIDWSFLNMYMVFIEKEGCELSASEWELYSQSYKIGEVFDDYGSRDEYFKSPRKLLALIRYWQRKTDKIFAKDVRAVVEHMSNDVIFQPKCLVHHSFSVRLLEDTIRNLVYIKDIVEGCLRKGVGDLLFELRLIEIYSDDLARCYDVDEEFVFSKHMSRLVLIIAHQAFDFWINRNDTELAKVTATKLVLLHFHIDPKHPEFMLWFLRFQVSVYGSAENDEHRTKVVLDFCNYILTGADHFLNSSEEKYLREELISMVPIYFQSALQVHFRRQDHSCLLEEISSMLGKILFLHREICQENINDHLKSCAKFLPKLRLLKMELLIKNYLSKSSILMLESQLSIVGNIIMEVGRFVQDFFLKRQNLGSSISCSPKN